MMVSPLRLDLYLICVSSILSIAFAKSQTFVLALNELFNEPRKMKKLRKCPGQIISIQSL